MQWWYLPSIQKKLAGQMDPVLLVGELPCRLRRLLVQNVGVYYCHVEQVEKTLDTTTSPSDGRSRSTTSAGHFFNTPHVSVVLLDGMWLADVLATPGTSLVRRCLVTNESSWMVVSMCTGRLSIDFIANMPSSAGDDTISPLVSSRLFQCNCTRGT